MGWLQRGRSNGVLEYWSDGSKSRTQCSITPTLQFPNLAYACAAFMSESSGNFTSTLNQLAPLSSLPKRSPFRCPAYMRSVLAGSNANVSTKLLLAFETSPSSLRQLLPLSVD